MNQIKELMLSARATKVSNVKSNSIERDKSVLIGSNTFKGASRAETKWSVPIGPKFQLLNLIRGVNIANI